MPANMPPNFILIVVMVFTAFLNYSIEKIAYRRLRNAPRLAPLISAIGVSFILQNVGLLWGKLAWHYGDYGALVGLVVFIVIMAVDHTRDFVHSAAMNFPPEDLTRITVYQHPDHETPSDWRPAS
jgi:branched-subunit amino acid ABC-type transport system permease component